MCQLIGRMKKPLTNRTDASPIHPLPRPTDSTPKEKTTIRRRHHHHFRIRRRLDSYLVSRQDILLSQ